MDQTPEYLEMCSKLPSEIRKLVPKDHQGCMGGDKSFFGYHERLNGMVWLPRQDQLQTMIYERGYNNYFYYHNRFTEFLDENFRDFLTYEQLWLAFVMHEKYGLNWSSERKEWTQ
jgi:hypothetical protein